MRKFRKIIPIVITCLLFGTYSVNALATVSPDSVIGTWEGEYQGTDADYNKITRKITLDITECNEEGNIDGTATIDDGENGKYSIDGNVDLENDRISFSGDEWIIKPEVFGFSDFDGTFNTNATEIFGIKDNDEFDTFSMKKVSDSSDTELDLTQIPLSWNGEYDGVHGSDGTVRRNLSFTIDEIKEDGGISGTAVFSPSDKSDDEYAANGSYHFTGTIDAANGTITLMGDEWLERPIDKDNLTWEFVNLKGCINNDEIKGFSENGVWRMRAFDSDEYNVDSGFLLGKDNNSYTNANNTDSSGFSGLTSYPISDDNMVNLLLDKMPPEKKWEMNVLLAGSEQWIGECFGMAATMGIVFQGEKDLQEITDSGADTYYEIASPIEDETFLNTINFYHLSQFLSGKGPIGSRISETFKNEEYSYLDKWNIKYDTLPVFLKKLVENAKSGDVYVLCYNTKSTGHALLVAGCKYNQKTRQYEIRLYDGNSIRSDNDTGSFSTFYISDDFSDFYTDNKTIPGFSAKTYSGLTLLPISSFIDFAKKESGSADMTEETNKATYSTSIDLDSRYGLSLETSDGSRLEYKDYKFSGDLPINGFYPTYETPSRNMIETDYVKEIEITPEKENMKVSVGDHIGGIAVEGKHIEKARICTETGVDIYGSDYDFTVRITTKYEEKELKEFVIKGHGNANISIKKENNKVLIHSDETVDISSIQTSGFDEGLTPYLNDVEENISGKEITINTENDAISTNSSVNGAPFIIIIPIVVIVVIVVAIMKKKKKN